MMELVYNEQTGMWEERKEPYCTLEFATEEDWNFFLKMRDFWNEHHKESEE